MASSNAERQARWRDRQKGSQPLRNTLAYHLGQQTEIDLAGDEADGPEEIRALVADSVAESLDQMNVYGRLQTGLSSHDGDPAELEVHEKAIVEMMGGYDYCIEVAAYQQALNEVVAYNKRRKSENCKPKPAAPGIPVT